MLSSSEHNQQCKKTKLKLRIINVTDADLMTQLPNTLERLINEDNTGENLTFSGSNSKVNETKQKEFSNELSNSEKPESVFRIPVGPAPRARIYTQVLEMTLIEKDLATFIEMTFAKLSSCSSLEPDDSSLESRDLYSDLHIEEIDPSRRSSSSEPDDSSYESSDLYIEEVGPSRRSPNRPRGGPRIRRPRSHNPSLAPIRTMNGINSVNISKRFQNFCKGGRRRGYNRRGGRRY